MKLRNGKHTIRENRICKNCDKIPDFINNKNHNETANNNVVL